MMHEIQFTLRDSLNDGHRLSGLQAWTSSLEREFARFPALSDGDETAAVESFVDRMAPLAAELLLSTPENPRPCPLLEVFRSRASDQSTLMGQSGLVDKLIGSFESVFSDSKIQPSSNSLLARLRTLASGWSLRGLELRCATLQLLWRAMGGKNESKLLKNCIEHLITAYQDYFSTDCWSEIPGDCQYRCAGFHQLHEIGSMRIQSADQHNNAASSIVDAIEASKFARCHRDPAVAFVCDTFALALGFPCSSAQPLGANWLPGDTWILLGAKDSRASSGTGMVLRLRSEKVELTPHRSQHRESCPAVCYPDPRLAAHSPIDEDFQIGIRNAWITTIYQTGKFGMGHDFRWHLAAVDRSDDHVQRRILGASGLQGESGTLAFAASLRSCEEQKLLRQDTACSAAFELEFGSNRPIDDRTFSNPRLSKVGLVSDKANAASIDLLSPQRQVAPWKQGQPAFANKIKRIVVAEKQPLEFPAELELVPVSEWNFAWREMNDAESLISQFAKHAAARWDHIRSSQRSDLLNNRLDRRLNDIHRLDLYIPPEFQWEDPNPEYQQGRVAGEGPWKTTKLESPRPEQLLEALRYGVENNRSLVLMDGAGAGKTVTSFKVQQLLSDSTTGPTIFGESLPRLVFHWSSKLPSVGDSDAPLVPLIASDPSLVAILVGRQNAVPSNSATSAEAEQLVRYALSEKRVVVIVDALDELKGEQPKLIKRAFEDSLEAGNVFWIFTGRDYAINAESARGGIFQSDAFRRVRISPFTAELQDEYMAIALPEVNWRESLEGADDSWDELLGLPHTLREIVRIFELQSPSGNPPKFESPSDLFLQCSDKMLERELGDKEKPPLTMDDEKIAMKTSIDILERALGAIAFELACKNQWKELSAAASEVERSINLVMIGAKERFRMSWLADGYDYDAETCWNWARRILSQFELMNGANQADIGARVVSFSTRRVQEMRVAKYLTNYATDADLRGTSDSMCALAHIGDPSWENVWKATIKMPVARTVLERYRAAIQILFERPSRIQRRPTELMWIADRWIRRVSALVGFRDELREGARTAV